jgi:hypothetical protein
VYNDAEAIFSRLTDEARKLRDWAALAWAEAAGGGGREGLEGIVEARCLELQDFEANLKGLKASWAVCLFVALLSSLPGPFAWRRQQITRSPILTCLPTKPIRNAETQRSNQPQAAGRDLERLPAEIRADCYRVVTAPFKAGVEEGVRRMREALGAVLRRKVNFGWWLAVGLPRQIVKLQKHKSTDNRLNTNQPTKHHPKSANRQALDERRAIEEFLSAGETLIGASPASAAEIGRAGQEARGLVGRLGEVAKVGGGGRFWLVE